MPRTKGAPARRLVIPSAGGEVNNKQTCNSQHGHAELSRELPEVSEPEVEPESISPRPHKRRRKLPNEESEIATQLALVDSHELLGFLQLGDILAVVVDDVTAGPAAAVRAVTTSKDDGLPLASLELLRIGQSVTVHLAAPSVATASNLVWLLQDGMLGVALHTTGDPHAGSSSSGSTHPVLYALDFGASPNIQLHSLITPTSGSPGCSACTSGRSGATAACAAAGCSAVRCPCGLRGTAQPTHQGSDDWRPAIYVSSKGSQPQGSCTVRRGLQPQLVSSGAASSSSAAQPAAGAAGASAEPGQSVSLRLGVRASALERLATSDPEDIQTRAWQGKLLDVLGWLLPHNIANTAAEELAPPPILTHQQEGQPGPFRPDTVPGSPVDCGGAGPSRPALASPKSPAVGAVGAAAAAAPGPTTPMSPGAAAAAAQGFDPGWLYGAVKPSGGEPQWMADPAELRPRLRPYQRRAVAWMLQRERPDGEDSGLNLSRGSGPGAGRASGSAAATAGQAQAQAQGPSAALHPLWRRLRTLPGSAADALYVNAYTGALASEPFPPPGPVRGGILADEMGLGKTVELLALITAHRFVPPPAPPPPQQQQRGTKTAGRARNGKAGTSPAVAPDRLPERVDCPCGVRSDDPNDPRLEDYDGIWIQCDSCNAWMHGACVGVKRSPRSAWACTRCLRARALATVSEPCGATLIVVPSAILQQWYDEIRRHVHPGALQVVVYGGQVQPGASSSGLICGSFNEGGGSGRGGAARRGQASLGGAGGADGVDVAESMVVSASQLAAADMVLTTYDVLKRDVARQPDLQAQERSLRHGKRYEVVPTPLTRLRWWRVVLDEAQMVESSTAKAAEMALKLDTVHRWCVTGTPISRGLEDVYGLMAFLGARPWSERRWWNRCVQRPVEAGDPAGRRLLLHLLRPTPTAAGVCGAALGGAGASVRCGGGLMWRSAKRDVEAELGLPAQSTHITHLRLNAVELHFYNRQHQDCATKARAVLPPRVVAAMESGRLLGGGGGGAEPEAREGEQPQDGEDMRDVEAEQQEGQAAPAEAEAEVAGAAASECGLAQRYAGSAAGLAAEGAGGGAAGGATIAGGAAAAAAVAAAAGPLGSAPQLRRQEPQEPQQQSEGHAAAPVTTAELAQRDPLQELHDLHRRRWEQWRQVAEEGGSLQGQAAGGGGPSSSAAAAAAVEGDPMQVDPTGAKVAAEEGPEGGAGGDDHDDDGGGCCEAGPSGGHGGSGGGRRRASPPRLDGPRKALVALASSLDRPLAAHEARKLLGPLLKLRQACCHPQVGAGGIRALTATGQPHLHPHHPGGPHHNAPMTMAEILAVLVTRAKIEAEEAQRQLIASLNGLAALMIIQGDRVEAISTYRKALRVMEDNKPEIGTDPLQRLHTLHNLAEMLVAAAAAAAPAALAAVPRTLRDHTLEEDAAAIRSRYLEQRRQQLVAVEADYRELVAASSPFHGAAGWYVAAIDLLLSEGHGPAATEHIKEKLLEGDTYRQKTEVNASSLAHRFNSLLGLKVLLSESLDAIEQHRSAAMCALEELGSRTRQSTPAPEFVEQAGQCGRCRSGPVRALVCEHCRLDERFIQWEVRLFALYSRALTAGATVTAEEAARRAQAAMVRWAGRGGLHEEQGAVSAELAEEGDDEFGSRRGANVAVANTSWRQSEAEMVLRLLVALLRQHFKHRADEPRVEGIMREGKAHVSRLEAQRRLLVAARSTSLAQRALLYAHDELGMATLRMRLVREGEPILAHEFNLKLPGLEAVPIKNVELTNDRIVAEGDLRRTLGTLRYLRKLQTIDNRQQERKREQQQQLQQQQQQQQQGQSPGGGAPADDNVAAAAGTSGSTAAADAASALGPSEPQPSADDASEPQPQPQSSSPASGPVPAMGATTPLDAVAGNPGGDSAASAEPEVEVCPICHDPLDASRAASVILPCGHQMHPPCSEALVAKTVAPGTPHHQRRITCPTCRTRVHVADIAYIDAGLTRGSDGAGGSASAGDGPWAGEAAVVVRGSFGTKIEAVVRRVKFVLGQDAAAKVLVFSGWVDLLELVAAALAANAVPYVMARGRGGMAAALAAFKDHPGELDSLGGIGLDDDDEGPLERSDAEGAARLADQRPPEAGSTEQQPAAGAPDASGIAAPAGGVALKKVEEKAHAGGSGAPPPPPPLPPPQQQQQAQGSGESSASGRPAAKAAPRGSLRAALASPAKQGQARPRVLLLQLKQGGAGLNLTEAQHVVLVEPQLDPAAEAQAVGRVHRIGQTRPTHVHRFVVTHTVEEQVFKLASARACGMDLSVAVPGARGAHGAGHLGRGGGGGGGDGNEQLTVRDVAVLLDTRWGEGAVVAAAAAPAAAAAEPTETVASPSAALASPAAAAQRLRRGMAAG